MGLTRTFVTVVDPWVALAASSRGKTSFYCTVCDGGVAADGRSLASVSCQMACVHALVRRLLHCTEQIFPFVFVSLLTCRRQLMW